VAPLLDERGRRETKETDRGKTLNLGRALAGSPTEYFAERGGVEEGEGSEEPFNSGLDKREVQGPKRWDWGRLGTLV